MALVFFEGFNYSSEDDIITLNPSNWSVNNPSSLTFLSGRTDNAVGITSRISADTNLNNNNVLSLTNFTDPLESKNGFALGFAYTTNSIHHSSLFTTPQTPAFNERCLSFHDSSGAEVLRLDFIRTSGIYGNSVGLGVYQNGNLIDTYDFKSHVGYSWTVLSSNTTTYIANAPSYLEFYINAKSSPFIRFNFTSNTSYEAPLISFAGSTNIPINGFSTLKTIKFYSNSNLLSSTVGIDDLYLSSGDDANEALLGYNTKIYKLSLSKNSTPMQWLNQDGINQLSFSSLNSNDGDLSYGISSASGNVAMFEISNLASSAPANVGGIKINNIVRSSDPNVSWNMKNLVSTGGSAVEIVDNYLVNSTTYSNKEAFLFNNPITVSPWTKNEINSLLVGIKNNGQA